MRLKGVLAGSASALAILTAAAPSYAQSADQPETVVVTGLRYSEQQSLDLKRNADTMVDAIVASDIGKLPDKNVADALQRIPGVETFSQSSGEGGFDENDRVALRGTDPSLTLTTIDGHSVATGDWYILDQFQTVGRSVSYDMLPAEMVSSVVVHKSQQADMVEGGAAGTVDIITRKPLDFQNDVTFEGSAQGVYSDLPHKMDPQINGLLAWHDPSDHFGIMVQGFYEERDLRREGQEFLGYSTISCTGMNASAPVNASNPCNVHAPGQPYLINGALATLGVNLNGVLYPTLIGAALFEQHRTREGGDVSMEWRPTKELDFVVSGFYSKLNAGDTNNNFMSWGTNEIGNNQNLPTSVTVQNNTLVLANFPKVNDNCGTYFGNAPYSGCGANVNGLVEDSIDRPNEGSSTWYINGDAKWNPSSVLSVDYQIGYTKGLGTTPSQPTWESEGVTGTNWNFTNGTPAAVSFPDISTTNPSQMANDWAWSDQFTAVDTEFYTKADAEWELDDGILQSIKAGGRFDQHSRKTFGFDEGLSFPLNSNAISNGQFYPSNFASGINPPAGFLQNIWAPNWAEVQAIVMPGLLAKNAGLGFPGSQYDPGFNYWPGSFGVKETVYAGYAMANLGGTNWKGNVGLRYVETKEDIQSYAALGNFNGAVTACLTPGATFDYYGCFDQVTTSHTYIDPLPSANFSYNLTDDMVVRAAVARVIARPDYSALGGAVNLTDSILTGTGGNPNLRPVRAWDYQASWEWYFAKGGLLSVTPFYMDLTTDVDFGVSNASYLNSTLTGQQGHPVFSTYAITSPVNGTGTDKGVEFAWDQNIWGGFGVETNATISDGEQGKASGGGPLIGDSKFLYNVVGYWEGYGFSTRLAYTWRSKVLVGLDRSTAENEAAVGSLALSLNYDVCDNLTLTFDALNLNDPILKYYANNTTQPRAFYDNGRQFYFGVKVKY